MALRYIALVFPGNLLESIDTAVDRVIAVTGFTKVAAFGRAVVLVEPGSPFVIADDRAGIILGYMFEKVGGGSRQVEAISQAPPTSRGSSNWGAYVTIRQNPDDMAIEIARDPSGMIPCYHVRHKGIIAFASEPALLVEAGLAGTNIDWRALTRFLITDQMRPAQTCIEGLTELPGGSQMRVAETGSQDVAAFWSPWQHTDRLSLIRDEVEAVRLLRETIMDCVQAWTQPFAHVLLYLSGGLDSSIVAAAMPQDVRASHMTLVTADPSGDERDYARQLTNQLGQPLFERMLEVGLVDLHRSGAARFPRPSVRSFAQAGDALGIGLADEIGADVFFNGGGGDNVFCYLQSGAPIADQMLVEGIGGGTLRAIMDMSALAHADIWSVARSGWRKSRQKAARYVWKPDLSFLSPFATQEATAACRHDWLDAPDGALPGTASHIALLLRIQNHLDSERGFNRPVISPLLSQPIVELCLKISSWLWCRDGRNRSVARKAFETTLPLPLIARLSKGTPDSFVATLFEAHQNTIAAMLREGLLAQAGLLDMGAIEQSVDRSQHARNGDFWRLMRLVDAEAWAQSWAARQ
ncbi:asparagine synthase (glutamine-hydrolyzing) [Sphingobium sp. JAI105]|uniref:asparagine synthase-related protein n=1 Tax=Sphingobium sp. JAI105 TaxID=2787715 RepID=UPI0018CA0C3E|nr:asparagine synthase-related protein [Sphingobium sp. JAI105]MBG6118393.1 asparagine synthase (glutamine-hydrolyzing) [Sphingobium sp. JAI105]